MAENLPGSALIDPDEVRERFKEDYACAAEVLAESLVRIIKEKDGQAAYIADLRDQLECAVLMHSEACIAERELRRLLNGDLYTGNGAAVLQGAASAASEASAEPEAPAPAPEVVLAVPEPVAEPKPAPVQVVAPAPPAPRPAPAVAAREPMAPKRAPKEHKDDRIVADALPGLFEKYPGGLSVKTIAGDLSMEYAHVYSAIKRMDAADLIDYVRRRDKNEKLVLPKGGSLPTPRVTANQSKVLAYLTVKCPPDTGGEASFADIGGACGISPGSIGQITDSLEQKGFLQIVGRGRPGAVRSYRVLPMAAEVLSVAAAPVMAPAAPEPRKAVVVAPTTAPVPIMETVEVEEGAAQVLDLRLGICHWPIENSPTGADQRYCAKPCSSAEQYCRVHRLAMYAAPRAKTPRNQGAVH